MNYKKERKKHDDEDDDDGGKDGGNEERRVFLTSLITFAIFLATSSLGTAMRKGGSSQRTLAETILL